MVAVSSDKRSLNRLPCSMAVSESSQSALIGEFRNISLDGGFIATKAPLPQGSVLPLVFRLKEDGPSIRAEAEVARLNDEGMGLRFLNMSSQDARRLRRYVSDLVETVGNRENAERLLDVDSRTTEPITDTNKIRAILQPGPSPRVFTILPATRVVREQATLVKTTDTSLQMSIEKTCQLLPGEDVLVLHTHDFVSYFFRTTVRGVYANGVEIELPSALKYSERRASRRDGKVEDAAVKFAVPWRKNELVSWDVVERGPGGLSFRADPKDGYFWPGTPLPQAVFCHEGREEPLAGAIVKHLTTMEGESGPWLRVGVAFGADTQRATVTSISSQSPTDNSIWREIARRTQRAFAALEYLYHSKVRAAFSKNNAAPFTVVKFANKAGKSVTGLLNMSFQDPSKKSVRAPLIIIVPGYAVRKETLSAMALTFTHNFRRQHRDVAVLRFDAVNNLGESEKNKGCEAEGKETLQWTISDGVNDLLGALAWAKNNRYVDPTNIVLVTVSIGSIAGRRVMTMPEASLVSHWIAFHGAPDPSNTVMLAAGNVDLFGNYERGIKTGVISMMGCLGDAEYFCRDAYAIQNATLEDARRDMAQVKASVTWVVGKHDAYVDGQRVRDIMSVTSAGDREIISVGSGHMPRASDEALEQFGMLTQHMWRRLYGREMAPDVPSHGWLAAIGEREWKRVRHGAPSDAKGWWKDYLLGDNGLGFDAWALTPEYNQLIGDQINLLPKTASKVLDLGAGTGNVSQAILRHGVQDLTAVDLVPEALERIKQKVGADKVTTVAASIEGTPRTAMTRWLAGELGSVKDLAERLPAATHDAMTRIAEGCNHEILSVLRGNKLRAKDALRRARLPEDLEATLSGAQNLARLCRGLPLLPAPPATEGLFAEAMASSKGLPFADNTFDAIVCSIVLSYVEYPDDSLFEMRRILKPGGTLIISSMRPDADSSKAFVNGIALVETMPESALPAGFTRESLLKALRDFVDHSAQLLRLEEEGAFHFWEGDTLARMVLEAGFDDATIIPSCGEPPMAVIIKCTKT